MRRYFAFIVPIMLFISACGVLAPHGTPSQTAPAVLPSFTPTPPPTPTPYIYLPTPTPAITYQPSTTETSDPSRAQGPFVVRLHPDGERYVGDQVSLEVFPEDGKPMDGFEVQVEAPQGVTLGPTAFGQHGIARRSQATLLWAWDTSGLEAGDYSLSFSLLPGGPSWTQEVSLLPGTSVPYPEPGAAWAEAKSDCCAIHYITGTAADRDLPELIVILDEQAQRASQQLETDIEEPISITFLPRVLGHGGFASQDISISYLDRSYAGGSPTFVLYHEMIHKLDGSLGGDFRPSILIEGLAVYLNGGHFKPEPLTARAAALLPPAEGCEPVDTTNTFEYTSEITTPCALDWYIPLEELVDDFYFSQHEIGYLEAGALVEYMVGTWGWLAYETFYRDIKPYQSEPGSAVEISGKQSLALEDALKAHFGLTLVELEEQFLEALRQETLLPPNVEDVRFTVQFYDTLRRYQQLLDPSAYFLTAWLMDGEQMREREIVADYLRRPSTPKNYALEIMLVAADASLRSGDFQQTGNLLEAVNAVLDAVSDQNTHPFLAHQLAADYLAIVHTLLSEGYQPQKVQLGEGLAQVWVIKDEPSLILLKMARSGNGWEILLEAQ